MLLTPAAKAIEGPSPLNEWKRKTHEYVVLDQFNNPTNPKVYYETTGPEVWEVPAARSTLSSRPSAPAATISGVGKYLREQSPDVAIIGVEPADSPVLNGGQAGPTRSRDRHTTGFVPGTSTPRSTMRC